MPTSIIAAVVSYGVGAYLGPGILATVVGGLAGSLVSNVIGSAFADKPDQPANQLDQQASNRLLTLRQPIAPWQWIYGQVRVGGALTYVEDSGNGNLHLIVTLAGHACEELGDIWFDDEVVPLEGSGNATGTFAGYVRIEKSLGAESASTHPFPSLVSESAGLWTNDHKQAGRAKLYVRLTWNADLFPRGIPNITCLVKGRKVYDPRSTLTAWSANPALCIADYFTADESVGLGCVYADEIDEAQLIAAANICDENVSLAAGGTEDRYTLNGAFAINASPREIVGRLNTAHGGVSRFLGGTWGVYPAVYATPTVTLTADDLRGGLHVMPRISRRDLANGVKGIYVSPANSWQASDFPAVTNATYLTEDSEERIWRELDLPFTTSAATAQRIAKI